MFKAAIAFLILAIIAGILGFGGIAGTALGFAKIAFIVGLVLAACFGLAGLIIGNDPSVR